MDRKKPPHLRTKHEDANIEPDELADLGLRHAVESGRYISSVFPLEPLRFMMGKQKLVSSPKKSFLLFWGKRHARRFLHAKGIVSKYNFHLVWWDGLERIQKCFPKMLRVFLTKQVADCSGTNQQLHYWDESHDPLCPCCKKALETARHITRCRDRT